MAIVWIRPFFPSGFAFSSSEEYQTWNWNVFLAFHAGFGEFKESENTSRSTEGAWSWMSEALSCVEMAENAALWLQLDVTLNMFIIGLALSKKKVKWIDTEYASDCYGKGQADDINVALFRQFHSMGRGQSKIDPRTRHRRHHFDPRSSVPPRLGRLTFSRESRRPRYLRQPGQSSPEIEVEDVLDRKHLPFCLRTLGT
jgi:hypothetical protein